MSNYLNIYCPACGKQHQIQKKETVEKAYYKGVTVNYICAYYHCDKTGMNFQTDELLKKSIDSAKKAYETAIENEEKGEDNGKKSKH